MRIFKNKVWISCVLLLGLHQLWERVLHVKIEFLDNYLDPFLSIPILLGLILQERLYVLKRYFNQVQTNTYQLLPLEIVVSTLLFAIVFEEAFSYLSDQFFRDIWDYPAYFAGALIFYIFINKPALETPK